jgi:hypothetical protein
MRQFIDRHANCIHGFTAFVWLMVSASTARAAWMDAAWLYRRPIEVTWDADHASGNELATAEFYCDGHALPNAEDIRVATDDGKVVASHILMNGPGDRVRLVFSLQKGIKKYAVYFGNPKPPALPEELQDVKFQAGLMIETRAWTSAPVNDFFQIEQSWNQSAAALGQAMIPNAFLGYNLFGEQDRYISKIVGSLFVPLDGEYFFAMSVDDEGALYIDGRPLLFAHLGPSDIRYHASITLTRGPHEFLLYHVNAGGDGRFAVAWRRPDSAQFEIIGRQTFGTCFGSVVGAMEELNKPLVADFSVTNVGECFFADHYSLRYHFTSAAKPLSPATYTWDFGDGQTAAQPELDHVFLTDGIYPVRLMIHIGPNVQMQSSKIVVSRNYENLLTPDEDEPKVLSKTVENYDLKTMPAVSLARVVMLHLRAERLDTALAAADELAQRKKVSDVAAAASAMEAVDHELINDDRPELAAAMWERVPIRADLQPRAAKRAAQLAMWWAGDFDTAVKLLEPFKKSSDHSVQRLYAQALILDGKPEEGKTILRNLPAQGPEDRQAALSGASARSVEFFIRQAESEAGEEAWERWQARYPSDFLEGYSVLLRTRLIELRKNPATAAKVAEAFARSVPQSSYAPQLLDRASKLLSSSDAGKSRSLRDLLKQKYPEDPLSQ